MAWLAEKDMVFIKIQPLLKTTLLIIFVLDISRIGQLIIELIWINKEISSDF